MKSNAFSLRALTTSYTPASIKQKDTHNKPNKDEYNNTIYYPASSREWFSNVYSYNKSYIKPFVVYDNILNNTLSSYFNMLKDKTKILSKRRRDNKSRYSANKVYVSRAEFKHINTETIIIVSTYNKQKSTSLRLIKKIVYIVKKSRMVNRVKGMFSNLLSSKWSMYYLKKVEFIKGLILNKDLILNKNQQSNKYPKSIFDFIYKIKLKSNKTLKMLEKNTRSISFNKLTSNHLVINWRKLGINSLIAKIHDKKVKIKLVELKSLHLNSDVFSSAVALKLRDRKNKAVKILRKSILQMVKIPDLHTLITSDDNTQTINKNNILNTIKQKVVSGVRFEASGRLTKRLTAMRAVFKYRYLGSLKNIRSSFNNKSSTMLRGFDKANLQYTLVNSKTRNGTFGLKGWVSSH